MASDPRPVDRPAVLASGTAVGGAAPSDAGIALPRLPALSSRFSLPRLRLATHPLVARIALAVLFVGVALVVIVATASPSALVPKSAQVFPNWEAGPLHGLFPRLISNPLTINLGLSAVVVALGLAYGALVASVRTLSLRTIVIAIVALHMLLLLSPPLQLSDLFNYLGYARLGALHNLNPYANVISAEIHDPVFRFTSWHDLSSPYGPLFTEITYPIALLPMATAYWLLKVIAVLTSLGFLALVWRVARQLGRDPRYALAFVAFNPIYLIYEVGGFHNDFFMLIPSMAAISLLLARRDRSAGAMVTLAIAVKFTAVLLLPFLLLAARPMRRRVQIVVGCALAAIPLVALDLALFRFSIPNLQDQSTLLTGVSIPNLLGDIIGVGGGAAGLLRVVTVALVVFVALLLWRRTPWLEGAGWATLALIASLAWLVPWYIVWLLPLAALGASGRLRKASAVLTVYLVIGFIPATGIFLQMHGINLLGGSAGQASTTLENKLAQ